jgi:polyketide synthase
MDSGKSDLVTGASGFIGGHLARRLIADGVPVRVLCRPGSERKLAPEIRQHAELVFGDLQDRESLRQAALNTRRIFHCAGYVSDWGGSDDFIAMNVQGTRWLLEGARAAHAERFIHLSSIAAFGTPAPEYFDDDSKYGDSKDHYSRTKADGERAVFMFREATGLPVTVLRPAVVYGPGGTWLEEPVRMIEKGKMFLLGGGQGTCHPCYIENLIDAMLLSAVHPAAVGRGYIVFDGASISFREYFNSLAHLAGKPPIRRSIPMPLAHAIAAVCEGAARLQRTASSPSRQRPLLTRTAIQMVTTRSRTSSQRIQDELGYKPRYSFGSAIDELRAWYHSCYQAGLSESATSSGARARR